MWENRRSYRNDGDFFSDNEKRKSINDSLLKTKKVLMDYVEKKIGEDNED